MRGSFLAELSSRRSGLILLALVILFPVFWSRAEMPLGSLLAPVTALTVILITRRALAGLLAGALAGAIILREGNFLAALADLPLQHLLWDLQSPWKQGALAFTLLLGGFAGLLEAGGGFTTLVKRLEGRRAPSARAERVALETALGGLGLLCFFDGLANSMVVGRVGRSLADRVGTARVKLAYIADTTSSAVACVAIISTWIAFQLSMISEAFQQVGMDVNPYQIFLRSIPLNFYCWFALILLAVAVRRQFHPGPMQEYTNRNAAPAGEPDHALDGAPEHGPGVATALLPLAVLLGSFLLGFLILGSEGPVLPLTRDKLVAAFGSDQGPLVMVLAALVAALAAFLVYPRRQSGGMKTAGRAYASGLGGMIRPLLILLAAWMLGSVVTDLGTADLLAEWVAKVGNLKLFPVMVFLTGAAVSFATGTSWGTMGLLFPLLVPAGARLGAGEDLLVLVVAAIFSGAVFGDHCSPFSDTTIVTSLSCGVEPHDHVRTQLPYAFIAAAVAIAFGFLPAGLGLSPWLSLGLGGLVLVLIPRIWHSRPPSKNTP